MNERLFSLSKEAFAHAVVHGKDYKPQTEFDRVYDEKFAELIVKECINCATWVGKHNKTSVPSESTAHAIGIRIKKHFGVE